jgi:hypothetical protein
MSDELGRVHPRRAASELCRAALARGPLIRDGKHWRFGRRRFSNVTVKRLIDEGAAVRDGPTVIQTRLQARKNRLQQSNDEANK